MLTILHRATVELDPQQLRALASAFSSSPNPPTSQRIQREVGLTTARATNLARGLAEAWAAGANTTDAKTILNILATERAFAAARATRVEIVCTSPVDLGMAVRATLPKALEMVEAATREIVVVGYVFSEGARELLGRLAAAQARGVRVTFVANRLRDHAQEFVRLWPAGARLPELYSRDPNPHDEMASLHAKLLICDGTTALVTSANFTHHGLRGNIEVGVCVSDAGIARLADFVSRLIATGEVLPFRPVPDSP